MRISASWQQRQIAGCLVFGLAVPFAGAANPQPHAIASAMRTAMVAAPQSQSSDSATATADPATSQPAPSASSSVAENSNDSSQEQSSATLPPAPQQQQNGTSNPVGTAAAPYETPTGVAASRPAGAVVAPAKQKRSRSFLIRVGLVIGACAAVGAVVGLSAASPGRP